MDFVNLLATYGLYSMNTDILMFPHGNATLTVVYFDQQTSAFQAICWSLYLMEIIFVLVAKVHMCELLKHKILWKAEHSYS